MLKVLGSLKALGCVLTVSIIGGYIFLLTNQRNAALAHSGALQVQLEIVQNERDVYQGALEELSKINQSNQKELSSKLATLQGVINEERRNSSTDPAGSSLGSDSCNGSCLDRLRRITKEANKQFR